MPVRVFNFFISVFASALFFPVSCTGIGVGAVAALETWGGRDHLAGEPVYESTPILAYGATCPDPYVVLAVSDIPDQLPTNRTLRLPPGETSIVLGQFQRYDFVVTDLDDDRQHVAFEYRVDDDHAWVVRYLVDTENITPVYTYIKSPGTAIQALGYGFSISLGLLVIARCLRYLLRRLTPEPDLDALEAQGLTNT